MNKHYSISERETAQILAIKSLRDEWENRKILKQLQQLIDRGENLFIIDLAELKTITSVGLNFLLSLFSSLDDKGGRLLLANVCDHVLRLLDITKLSTIFSLRDSVEDALRQLEEEAVLA